MTTPVEGVHYSDPVMAMLARLKMEAEDQAVDDGKHEWSMTFTYGMSEGAAREMMTGEKAEGEEKWKATHDGLLRLAGPKCLRCEKEWGPAVDQPCGGDAVFRGVNRPEKRRRDRLKKKVGEHATIEGDELLRLVREATDPLAVSG